MKASDKSKIDGLAKKAFESIVDGIPDDAASVEAAYRIPTIGRGVPGGRGLADPFAIVACALALIMVIPPAIGKTRTTFTDVATVACESGGLDGSANFMTMVFARGGERFRRSREMEK